MNTPLNILIYVPHDTGQHIGTYGKASVATPSLDRMAAEGIRFENHFCTSPACSASRGGIFTGRYPHCNGLMGLANPRWGWRLNPGERHLAGILRGAGYRTALLGAQHEIDFHHWPQYLEELGYEERHGDSIFISKLGPVVLDRLREWGSAQNADPKNSKPFFASICTYETHRVFRQPGYESDDPDAVWVPPYLPDEPDVRKDLGDFHGAIKVMDRFVGDILQALDETGLSKNTLFIFTPDHGIPYPRAKMSLYDAGIETALIMRGPNCFGGAKVFKEMISNIDILPTVLEVLGVGVPDNLQGKSFLPLLQGEGYVPRTEIFAEKTYHCRYDPIRCIRTDRYKYIRNWKPEDPIEIGCDRLLKVDGKDLQDRYPKTRSAEELYDLRGDPWEQENLAMKPTYSLIKNDLNRRLMEFLQETGDPLLAGPVPSPKEAVRIS